MAKHLDVAASSTPAVEVSQEEQRQLLEKLGGMTRKALAKIYENLVATKLCYMCLGRPGDCQDPLKRGEDGKCVNCAGVGRVPDFEKNKWAVNEVMARKLPMPKAIEMRVDDKTDKVALAKFFMGLPKAQVLELERKWNAEVERISKAATFVPAEEVPAVDAPSNPTN